MAGQVCYELLESGGVGWGAVTRLGGVDIVAFYGVKKDEGHSGHETPGGERTLLRLAARLRSLRVKLGLLALKCVRGIGRERKSVPLATAPLRRTTFSL